MASNQDTTGLLQTLKQLYSRIVALHTEARARSTLTHSSKASPPDIALPLSECIDMLTAKAVKHAPGTVQSDMPIIQNNVTEHATLSTSSSPDRKLGALSLHLKNSHKHPGIFQSTGDKLIQSTWEHFHAAVRFARQGDASTARIHMELTNSALNEAVRYLPEAEYKRFSGEILRALREINDQA